MERTDIAILVHTCPSYFYILDAFFGLLRRYGSDCKWPVYLATERSYDETILRVCNKYNIQLLALEEKDSDFLESRCAAMQLLPATIQYVLPLQEDFLLERPGLNVPSLTEALDLLDKDIHLASIRLMPCPGSTTSTVYKGMWNILTTKDCIFSYQATIWRRSVYHDYMIHLLRQEQIAYPELLQDRKAWCLHAIRNNPAETFPGLTLLKNLFPQMNHLCWSRKGVWANAVYWCPWPYRPTAIVKGNLEVWANELIRREGFYLQNN
jgi:hypothetical protein